MPQTNPLDHSNEARALPHMTDEQVRVAFNAMTDTPDSRYPHDAQPNPLHAVLEEGTRALNYRDGGSVDNPHRIAVPAVASTVIDLAQFIKDGDPAPNVYGVQNRPAGQTLNLDPRAIIEQHSRCAQAGARLIIAHPRNRAVAIDGNKTEGLIGWYQDPQLVRNVMPAGFSALADGSDAPVSALPFNDQVFAWGENPNAAFRVTVTRVQNRQVGGGEGLRDSLLSAIFMGLGEYADSLLLAAIAAATPATFSLGAAAAKYLRFSDLKALVGTNGAGAVVRQDGRLAVQGIDAELSAATSGTYVGAFGSAAIAIWPEVSVHARRTSVAGDLEVTCLVNAQAVLPDPGKFFSVAA